MTEHTDDSPDLTDVQQSRRAAGTDTAPPDAGPYTAGLQQILRRIPNHWGRWLSLHAGWYPLVVACDEHLAVIDPDYVVHQVKEKHGTLRYYCAPSAEEPSPGVLEAFDHLTDEAERTSAITCERCGEPAVLHASRSRVKTLCAACADHLGYAPA